MRNDRLIRVLWVENDSQITSTYPNEADMVAGITLYPFPCWKDAEAKLEEDYEFWDAIILDAKCPYQKDDADKAEKFLSHAIPRITQLAAQKHREIPWYVLSGEGEDDIRDLISDTNDKWDKDWVRKTNRRFYSKNGIINFGGKETHERQVLFKRIRAHVINFRYDLQIEYHLYCDVFSSLDRLDLSEEVGSVLMPLLRDIHFGETSNEDYNHRYIDLRKALETIFRHMVKMGIMPQVIIAKDAIKEKVNLSWSSLFLIGSQPEDPDSLADNYSEKKFWTTVERLTEGPIVPKQLADWLKSAIFQTGGAAHTTPAPEELARNLDKYLPHVGGSPYMLRSLVMGLCDFILWYDNFIKTHPDEEKNAIDFWRERNSKL